ncbi:MAG TPA: hypothetical protein VMP68_10335 [Candidatus Eisenbacteria bacterium]|nr:hypothetical protein [Candidatus Eisenbacteria bacterium]
MKSVKKREQGRQENVEHAMSRRAVRIAVLMALLVGAAMHCGAQTTSELNTYFQQNVGLSQDQIAAIRGGHAVAKVAKSRIPDEIFVFGAVYVNAPPERYLKLAYDFDRLRQIPGYEAIEKFSNPPQLSDLQGYAYDSEDIKALKNCKADDCELQVPASSIEALQKSVDFSAPDAEEKVNQYLHGIVIQRLLTYQKEGNQALGVYNDKKNPTNVPEQFKYMLSYSQLLPKIVPDLYNYLLDYPKAKPASAEDMFYWDKVKFGLKPTLRIVQVVSMPGNNPHEPAYTIAEKQLYASHYFETALDLTFCVSGDDAKQSGFYLIKFMGSEQAGLTGFKGSIVRKVAVGRSASSLEKSLMAIKDALEKNQ